MEDKNGNNSHKRGRDEAEEAELEIYSPEVKRLRENLLESFDDETETDFCSDNHDLDSFMKSFEVEISASPSAVAAANAADLTSDAGDSRPDLGFLFEASDDELGLPPTVSSTSSSGGATAELLRVESDSSDLGSEFWEAPGYDSFELGFGGGNDDYVALDGLFDYSDMGFGSGELVYRPETLPAQ